MCGLTHSYVWTDTFICADSYVWNDTCICVDSYVWTDIFICVDSYLWTDTFICVHSHVWNDTFMCVQCRALFAGRAVEYRALCQQNESSHVESFCRKKPLYSRALPAKRALRGALSRALPAKRALPRERPLGVFFCRGLSSAKLHLHSTILMSPFAESAP